MRKELVEDITDGFCRLLEGGHDGNRDAFANGLI